MEVRGIMGSGSDPFTKIARALVVVSVIVVHALGMTLLVSLPLLSQRPGEFTKCPCCANPWNAEAAGV